MVKDIHLGDERQPMAMNPKKFALWLFLVSVVMIFASLTSEFVVRQSEGNWLAYELPNVFWYSTGILLLSSVTMHWAYLSAKRNNIKKIKIALGSTLILGLLFLVTQLLGWGNMVEQQAYFVGNPAGSFLYVLTGLHGVHLLSGIIFIAIVVVSAFKFKVHSKSMSQIEMCATFWHFLDGLWLYLFVFLLLNH